MLKINKWNKHLVTLQLDIGGNKNTDVNDLNRGSKTFLRRSYQVLIEINTSHRATHWMKIFKKVQVILLRWFDEQQ